MSGFQLALSPPYDDKLGDDAVKIFEALNHSGVPLRAIDADEWVLPLRAMFGEDGPPLIGVLAPILIVADETVRAARDGLN